MFCCCASLQFRALNGVVCSSCLGVRIVELEVNCLPTLDSRCNLDDSGVWKSVLRLVESLPCWGSLEVCQWHGELEIAATRETTGCTDLILRTLSSRLFLFKQDPLEAILVIFGRSFFITSASSFFLLERCFALQERHSQK